LGLLSALSQAHTACKTALPSQQARPQNRIYTGIGDDELYVAVRDTDVERVAAKAQTIADANARLAEYHRGGRQELSTE
jgi:hypothetical protein